MISASPFTVGSGRHSCPSFSAPHDYFKVAEASPELPPQRLFLAPAPRLVLGRTPLIAEAPLQRLPSDVPSCPYDFLLNVSRVLPEYSVMH